MLDIPVYGLCDCNPFGVSVLMTYWRGSSKLGNDADSYSVCIKWLGLRPSHIAELSPDLPKEVFQSQSNLDSRKLDSLMSETCAFIDNYPERKEELFEMQESGYKLELESLQWIGLDFLVNWLIERIEEEDVI